MKPDIQALLKLAVKIRTPLALAGLVIVIFYAIYKEVLSLNIFANVGGNSTFLIIENIIDKVFWLAMVALVLGVISYLVPYFLSYRNKSLSSNVSLIDASLDQHNSPYQQYTEDGIKKIRHKGQQELANKEGRRDELKPS
jgi:hypothetical protein